ncbi:MAG TPA: BON domain-containing protein [Acidimicrobiales bacterium]|nr:BON domain-containing protein [Acidimicrobiales bacterium]
MTSPPDPPDPPDDEPVEYLVERVRTAIATRSEIHELGIGVQVAGGRLLLTGSASSVPQRDAITGVVEQVAPGYEVVNEVCVAPTTPPAAVERL